jgi:hypothetical protein
VKPINEETDKKGGLEPDEFRRQLFIVTGVVLGLGLFGGTCLGLKISEREKLDNAAAQTAPDQAPSETRSSPSSR